jgi:hypothetical protein
MKIAPLLLVLIAAIAVIAKSQEPEIRRYLKISSM